MDKKFGKTVREIVLAMAILFLFPPVTALAGSDFNTANDIVLNQSYSGTLEIEDDVDYYKFTTSKNDSFYKIELRNTEVTGRIELNLYSGDDATTAVYDFGASIETADFDTRKLEPNHTYYISIQGNYSKYMGNYKFSVTEIKDDVPDSYGNSTSLPLNKKAACSLEAVGDSDYFKFTTTSKDSYYKIELANTEASDTVTAILYYEDDVTTNKSEIKAYKASLGAKSIKLEPKHTYYIVVKGSNYDNPQGAYKLSVTEIKDDAADTFKNSKKIALNKKHNYKLNVDGDIDYFKFKASKSGTYTITLANKNKDNSIYATIYSDADITQDMASVSAYNSQKNSIKIKVKKNHTYYIAVQKSYSFYSGTGSYSLIIKR